MPAPRVPHDLTGRSFQLQRNSLQVMQQHFAENANSFPALPADFSLWARVGMSKMDTPSCHIGRKIGGCLGAGCPQK